MSKLLIVIQPYYENIKRVSVFELKKKKITTNNQFANMVELLEN